MILPADKYGHLGVGALLGLSGLWLGIYGLLPILAFAAGKEAWDHAHPPHKAEWLDFLATMAGGLLALGLISIRNYHG